MTKLTPTELVQYHVRDAVVDTLHRAGSFEHYTDEEIWAHIGYKPEDLVAHLEREFAPGMTWNNFKYNWVIDHYIPRSIFSFESIKSYNFQNCWAFDNLRPITIEQFKAREHHKKILVCDIDGTLISSDPEHDYTKAYPYDDRIKLINKMYDNGFIIILYTARGSVSTRDWYQYTKAQMKKFGVKFHILRATKLYYDIQVCDRTLYADDFFNDPKKSIERFPFLKDVLV